MIKINTDANLQIHGSWGLGCVSRDENGLVMATTTWQRNGFECAASAEAFGILSAMKFAFDCGFRNVIFESDCE